VSGRRRPVDIVAQAIREADRSWFNEDYAKQARAALTALQAAGFVVVPLEASDTLVEQGVESLPLGNVKPEEMVRQIYETLVTQARRTG